MGWNSATQAWFHAGVKRKPLLWYFVHLWMFGLPSSFPLRLIFNIFCTFRFHDQRYASPTMCLESETHVMMQRGMKTISSEHCTHLDAWKKPNWIHSDSLPPIKNNALLIHSKGKWDEHHLSDDWAETPSKINITSFFKTHKSIHSSDVKSTFKRFPAFHL